MAAKHAIKMTCPMTLSQQMLGKSAFPSGFTERMMLRGPTVTCRAMSGQVCRLWSCTGVFRQSQVGRCAPTWALSAHLEPRPPLLHARSRVLGGDTRLGTVAGEPCCAPQTETRLLSQVCVTTARGTEIWKDLNQFVSLLW